MGRNGVDASAWIWTHAQQVKDPAKLIEAAELGAWISLDGVRSGGERQRHLHFLFQSLVEAGYLNNILLSHETLIVKQPVSSGTG